MVNPPSLVRDELRGMRDTIPCMELFARLRAHRFATMLAVIAIPLVIIPLVWFLWQTASYYRDIKNGGAPSLQEQRLESSISTLVANAEVSQADRARTVPTSGLYPELGSWNARVTVVEFVDYQCPYCQRTADVVRRIMVGMGDRVRLIIRDFPITELHPGAKQSALAANCVLAQGQDMYWRYHDLLFADIERQAAADLRAKAEQVGVDLAAFDACVAQGRYLKKIDADIQDALRAGVQGTPTFFVNGIRIQGAVDEQTLTRVLNMVLEQVPQ
jgi:protein-disulfide isomerase